MLRIDRILCSVDFSEFSARAYDYAQSLARHGQAKLFLQHVVDFTLPSYAYYVSPSYIADLFQQFRHDARLQLEEFAKAYQQIIQHVKGVQADAVIMGVRGRNALDLAIFGSTTHRVIQ